MTRQKVRDRMAVIPVAVILDEPDMTILQDDPWQTAVHLKPGDGIMTTTFVTGFGIDLGRIDMMIAVTCNNGRMHVIWKVNAVRDGTIFRTDFTNRHIGSGRTIAEAYAGVVEAANALAATEIPDPATVMRLGMIAKAEEEAARIEYYATGRIPQVVGKGVLQ